MLEAKQYSFWFAIGSQHLYGQDILNKVEEHARRMVEDLNNEPTIDYQIVWKPILTRSEAIHRLCLEANTDQSCAGIITWMHTFSPAKMWIAGLLELKKPLLHLHTQFNRDIPWSEMDMDFMNLNQSAHGDREFGFITSRMNIARKVIVGHWQDHIVRKRLNRWMRTAVAFSESKTLKIARFGDNMRKVAVTEGDKVEAQIRLGWSIDGYGIGDLVECIQDVSEADIQSLLEEYSELYEIDDKNRHNSDKWESIKEQARIELGMKVFLREGNFGAFTTTFEDLHGMIQLPGLAVQRLMAAGYGFGGEGDWKTAGLVRLMKIIAGGKGTSFMEDYTYHLEPGNEMILGAHMLEVCPSLATTKPKLEVHPLSIGGKEDPARLIFEGVSGSAICASLVDMGNRFRLLINQVEAISNEHPMPNLPVARVLWKPEPSLTVSAEAWILAGGAHHTCFSYEVTAEDLLDWSEMVHIECLLIDRNTDRLAFRNLLRQNEGYWRFVH